ncbi:peptidylprolyl isomerase [Roseiterribacter gracilis]|uniref:Parvulin-like PPIase n=1 Tax=Roseiterribacter gracilis TaxID=2812848 RepID=A0A8S8XC88_9PROT|nr:peptidylprolyl isomerase [Rhodospirillales bacterium TMPK1]
MSSKSTGAVVAVVGGLVAVVAGLWVTGVIGNKGGGATSSPVVAVAQTAPTGPVIAKINGKEVRASEFDAFVAQLPAQLQQMPKDKLYPLIVDEMVATKLISAEAEKANLAKDPEVQQKVANAQTSIMQNVWLQRTIKAQTTDAMLKAKYDDFVKANPPQDEVHARHILVKTEAEAKDLIKQLDQGAQFERLAKEKSTEPGANESGGDLGYFTKDKMVPEFGEAAFKLEKDKYTKTPVHTSFGYHVVQVLDKRKQQLPTFEAVKPDLEAAVGEDVVRKVVTDLRNGAKVEKFNLDGTPMAAAATPAAPAVAAPAPAAK